MKIYIEKISKLVMVRRGEDTSKEARRYSLSIVRKYSADTTYLVA